MTLPSFWSKLQYSLRCFSTLKKNSSNLPPNIHKTLHTVKLYICHSHKRIFSTQSHSKPTHKLVWPLQFAIFAFFLMRNAHENLMRTVLPCYPLHWASQLGRPGGEENLLTKLGPCSPLLTMITWGATYDSYMIHMITVISLSSIDSLEIRNGINRIASPKFWHIVWPCLTQAT